MTQSARLTTIFQRIATEFKTVRSEQGNLKIQKLTQAQYAALGTPRDVNTRFIITDWSGTTTITTPPPSGGGTATLVPNAAGSKLTGWNYETAPSYSVVASNDGGTSAIYSPQANDVASFQLTDLPSNAAAVSSVTVHNSVFKIDPVSAVTHCILVVGGVVYESPDLSPSSNTAYEDLSYTWTTNPATGSAWTVAAVNALEAGIKKINSAGERCSYISAVVAYS